MSKYPSVVDLSLVGTYPALTKSGAGYVFDEVLEYRVWCHRVGGDYYQTFANYEEAAAFSLTTRGAEEPLALVRQHEWIDEPSRGVYIHMKTERITE